MQLINQALDEVLAEQEGEYDADTRWAIAWFDQYGMDEGSFGTAEYPNIYFSRCVVYLRVGQLQVAMDDCNHALQLKPDYADAYNARGGIRFQQGGYQGAIDDYSVYLQYNPDNGDAYTERADARLALKDTVGALNDYQRAAQIFQQVGDTERYTAVMAKIKALHP